MMYIHNNEHYTFDNNNDNNSNPNPSSMSAGCLKRQTIANIWHNIFINSYVVFTKCYTALKW